MDRKYKDDIVRNTEEEPVSRRGSVFTRSDARKLDSKRFRRLLPLVIVVGFAGFISYQELPWFQDGWEKTFFNAHWQAKKTCQEAAFAQISQPDFARILRPGTVNKTNNALFVDKLTIGEMGENATERRVHFTCYIDALGKLVSINKI